MTLYSIEFTTLDGSEATAPGVRAQGSLKLVSVAAKEALTPLPNGAQGWDTSVVINEINANGTRQRLSITADRESLEAIVKVTLNRLRKEAKDAGQEEDLTVADDRAEALGETEAQTAQDDTQEVADPRGSGADTHY